MPHTMSQHATMHDKAALTAMLIKSLREILKEPKNFVRTVAICDNALEMVDSSFPPIPASGSTIPTPHFVKAPVADRGLGGED
jgi:hypothetical protein